MPHLNRHCLTAVITSYSIHYTKLYDEEPIPGVSSATIFDRMKLANKKLAKTEEIIHMVENDSNEIILTMGAGDIDRMVNPITETLKKNAGV